MENLIWLMKNYKMKNLFFYSLLSLATLQLNKPLNIKDAALDFKSKLDIISKEHGYKLTPLPLAKNEIMKIYISKETFGAA